MRLLPQARAYWKETAEPDLRQKFPRLFPRIAAGLVGNGSECFGYDDRYSQDHDWGIDFFLWVEEADRESIPELSRWKEALFVHSPPPVLRRPSPYGIPPEIMTVGDFYRSLIGCAGVPETIRQWRLAPEVYYAMATNGAVFWDGSGHFSAVRSGLQAYYPEDLRRKKIAARCMALAQTGQYNLSRTVDREDWVTVRIILAEFSREAMGLVYHLNRVYRPYYKWMWRGLTDLPILGMQCAALLRDLARTEGLDTEACRYRQEIINRLCRLLVLELRRQGLSAKQDWFLAEHGRAVQQTIWDRTLRRMPPQFE